MKGRRVSNERWSKINLGMTRGEKGDVEGKRWSRINLKVINLRFELRNLLVNWNSKLVIIYKQGIG